MNAISYWRGRWQTLGLELPALLRRRRAPAKLRCSVDRCGRAVWARGNCHKHYTAARRVALRLVKSKRERRKVAARAITSAITEILPKADAPKAMGRGVCSSCDLVKPLFRFGAAISCRECRQEAAGG